MYIGFASEIFSIQQKNSNLNFDVSFIPQIREGKNKTTFGRMWAISLVKQSRQASSAYTLAVALTENSALRSMESVTNLPPVSRALLSQKPTGAFRSVFYDSALVSRSWIDPDAKATDEAFGRMVNSVTSGERKPSEALDRLNEELGALLR